MRSLVFLALVGLILIVAGLANLYGERGWGKSAGSATLNESSGLGLFAVAHAAGFQQEKAGQVEAQSTEGPQVDEATAKCLGCHGPYERLASKAGEFVIATYDGEKKINPHRYVPHDTKQVPACANCHEMHPIPPESEVAKPDNLTWCYSACHHQQDFTPCSACH